MLREIIPLTLSRRPIMVAASHDGTDSRGKDSSRSAPARSSDIRGRDRQDDLPTDGRSRDELAEAKSLLRSVPEMSDERMAEIKDRIKRGYYKRTDVLQRIAKRLTDQLSR